MSDAVSEMEWTPREHIELLEREVAKVRREKTLKSQQEAARLHQPSTHDSNGAKVAHIKALEEEVLKINRARAARHDEHTEKLTPAGNKSEGEHQRNSKSRTRHIGRKRLGNVTSDRRKRRRIEPVGQVGKQVADRRRANSRSTRRSPKRTAIAVKRMPARCKTERKHAYELTTTNYGTAAAAKLFGLRAMTPFKPMLRSLAERSMVLIGKAMHEWRLGRPADPMAPVGEFGHGETNGESIFSRDERLWLGLENSIRHFTAPDQEPLPQSEFSLTELACIQLGMVSCVWDENFYTEGVRGRLGKKFRMDIYTVWFSELSRTKTCSLSNSRITSES